MCRTYYVCIAEYSLEVAPTTVKDADYTKQDILDNPLAFIRQHNFSLEGVDCVWFIYLHLMHLGWDSDDVACACIALCGYYREMTTEEMEYRMYRNKYVTLSNVGRKQRKEWPWLLTFSFLALVAFTGEIFCIH
jgi:hypothetical protein